jgi:hypothetical protein
MEQRRREPWASAPGLFFRLGVLVYNCSELENKQSKRERVRYEKIFVCHVSVFSRFYCNDPCKRGYER